MRPRTSPRLPAPTNTVLLTAALTAAASLMLAPGAKGQGPVQHSVIFTNLAGLPTSEVPGIPGRVFKRGSSGDRFGNLYGSPNGNWIMTARTEANDARDEVLLVNGQLVYQEDVPAPWLGGSLNSGTFRPRMDINDSGDFVFCVRIPGVEDHIVRSVGGVLEGAALPGDPLAAPPGASVGARLRAPNLTADGTLGFYSDETQGPLGPGEDKLVILGSELLLQSGVSVPPGQSPDAGPAFEKLKASDLWVSEDGEHWLVRADLAGNSGFDDVVIVDGEVVVQERTTLPGFQFPIFTNGIRGASMDAGGNWYARGSNGGQGNDWLIRNGEVIARTGMPITPTTDEAFDDGSFTFGFFLHVGNSRGDHVIGGTTDASSNRDSVLVKNGERVLMRRGDPIDLDGNGLLDDDASLSFFVNDRAHLTDGGQLFIEAGLRVDSTGERFRAILVLDTNAPEIGQPYCDVVSNSTGAPSTLGAFGSTAVADGDVNLVATGMPPNVFGFFLASLDRGQLANPGGSAGNLCLSGQIGRFIEPGQVLSSGAEGTFALRLDLRALAQPSGFVAVAPLESWNFQAWHRDTLLGVASSNLTNGLTIDFQ